MRLGAIAAGIDGASILGSGSVEVLDLAYDSRRVRPGTMFMALPGEKLDGADFVPAAVAAGAVAVMTERPEPLSGLPQVVVPDARAAMAAAARSLLGDPAEGLKLVGITGTNGKTTTACLVRHILNASGLRCGMTGTVEYDLGSGAEPARMTTPESLDLYRFYAQMRRAGCRCAASEVSSHALVKRRVEGIRFSAAVFTNLTQDHLDFHGDMENYFLAKARLFQGLGPDAVAAVNRDDERSARLCAMTRARVIGFGLGPAPELRGQIMSLSTVGTVFRMTWGGFSAEVHMGLLGAHNVQNVLGAVAAVSALGVAPEQAVEAVAAFEGVPGRLESVDCGQDFRVLVDYAHTDDALRSVLGSIRELYPRRIITVFGCGGDRDRTKRPRMGRVVEELSDVAVVTSDNPRGEEPGGIIAAVLEGMADRQRAVVEPDRAAAIERAVGLAAPGDVVLIAGKGHETYQILGARRIDFDDRKVARAALERLGAAGEGRG